MGLVLYVYLAIISIAIKIHEKMNRSLLQRHQMLFMTLESN